MHAFTLICYSLEHQFILFMNNIQNVAQLSLYYEFRFLDGSKHTFKTNLKRKVVSIKIFPFLLSYSINEELFRNLNISE
jgi:hypothetical protein